MHESIATALYRGYTRRIKDATWNARLGRDLRAPRTRSAWLKACRRRVQAHPSLTVLSSAIIGKGKRAELRMLGVSMEEEESDGRTGWYAFSAEFQAKTYSAEFYDLPIFIAHHLVQRIMQRLAITDPREALSVLTPAIVHALWLVRPDEQSLLLPAHGGAVISVRDRGAEDEWAFVTFVDAEKLSEQQLRDLEYVIERAARSRDKRLAAYEQAANEQSDHADHTLAA